LQEAIPNRQLNIENPQEIVMANRIVESIEQPYLKKEPLQFSIGDTVDVATRIIEGEKERIQVFSGTVIARKGRGINETFTVRRIVNNEGVERIFPSHSPFIATVTVRRSGESRRAKLFYLRDRVGKAVRLTEKRRDKRGEEPQAAAAVETPALAASAT
jgi:large subunit ribosomal protein L19